MPLAHRWQTREKRVACAVRRPPEAVAVWRMVFRKICAARRGGRSCRRSGTDDGGRPQSISVLRAHPTRGAGGARAKTRQYSPTCCPPRVRRVSAASSCPHTSKTSNSHRLGGASSSTRCALPVPSWVTLLFALSRLLFEEIWRMKMNDTIKPYFTHIQMAISRRDMASGSMDIWSAARRAPPARPPGACGASWHGSSRARLLR